MAKTAHRRCLPSWKSSRRCTDAPIPTTPAKKPEQKKGRRRAGLGNRWNKREPAIPQGGRRAANAGLNDVAEKGSLAVVLGHTSLGVQAGVKIAGGIERQEFGNRAGGEGSQECAGAAVAQHPSRGQDVQPPAAVECDAFRIDAIAGGGRGLAESTERRAGC